MSGIVSPHSGQVQSVLDSRFTNEKGTKLEDLVPGLRGFLVQSFNTQISLFLRLARYTFMITKRASLSRRQ